MEGEKPIRIRPYKGIRMRKWGKWVAEIRQPNNRSRIWLGSYSSPLAAARAYDVAAFYLRRPAARLNFPEFLAGEAAPGNLSAAAIRKKANEVGSRVDAVESATSACGRGIRPCGLTGMPDLNKEPEPEDPSSDEWVSP